MSLYDDLDTGTGNKEAAGWSTGIKLLQSSLQTKKASTTPTQSSRKRGALNPVIDLKRASDEVHFDQKTGKLTRSGIAQFLSVEPSVFAGVKDEYNPMIPNDYDEIIKKRKRERRDRDLEREREREKERERDRERDRDRDRRRRRDSDEENDDRDSKKKSEMMPRRPDDEEDDYHRERPKRGAAIAPPPSLLEDESSNTPPPGSSDSGLVSNPFGLDEEPSPRVLPGTSIGMGGSVASKIMAKYGYKEGSGLGKSGQGMASALFVEKTSRRGGKIIHEKDIQRDSPTSMMLPPSKAAVSNADLLKNPSKVVLLRNMVGPGEVDSELEGETAEECAKYGKVTKCVIFEIPEVPEEESVRIFIEFEKQESAIKAIIDLNGRFFGGRVVKACFYSVDKFKRLDLADDLL